MRLDEYLVKKGYFSSRQIAKENVRRGMVLVNNFLVKKPSKQVSYEDEVVVLGLDVPKGYWKLKAIDEEFKLFSGKETVLDLGSSAGGFLLYASEKAKFVYGIEFSRDFEDVLRKIERERKNVKVFIANVFNFDLNLLPSLDLILNDLSLPFESSMKALGMFSSKLKDDGRVLFVCKGMKEREEFDGFEVVKKMVLDKKEIYYLLKSSKQVQQPPKQHLELF
ncbi:MAG: S4 domain-containing protein [Archaeoglobaceae archaeon]|nr:S4 domain-containing protein [Archaeoglobaceae archaeon]MCX8152521.1 S4 domain-containing protein [Archaeoglobaceae archaeon]MDW8014058.1 S4 domain-containing protein [Archaeoglobaceae archaeon]